MTAVTKKQREPVIDIIKGVAIILVLIGHVIQFASGAEYRSSGAFYDNILFKVIYSFHMPLFMVVSGFLFHHSVISKSPWTVIWDKIKALLLPIFSFAFIVWLFRFNSQYSFLDQIRNYLSVTRFTLWFLWALFYSSIGVLVGHYLFKDNVIVWLVLILASFLTPDKWFSELYKFTFPCFLFGFYVKKQAWMPFFKRNICFILPICSVLFIAGLLFYNVDCFVYMSGCNILSDGRIDFRQLWLDVYRIMVGLLGSIVFTSLMFILIRRIKDSKLAQLLAKVGMNTMGIYCFQTFFFQLYTMWFNSSIINTDTWAGLHFNRLLCLGLSFVISYGLTLTVRKIKFLSVCFLGGR